MAGITFQPHPYQAHAIQHIMEHPSSGLLLDMGLGKTVSTLTAITTLLHDSFDVQNVLVIAPKRVAEDTWSRETEKWQHTQYLKVSKVLGSEVKRLEALKQKADIYVINRENVEWLVNHFKTKWPFDMVVIDELSSFKSSKANRFKALRKVKPLIKRIVGLTGTPAPNGLLDLWPQLYLLDSGERLGRTVTAYRDRYFQPGRRQGQIVYDWELKKGAEDEIYKRIEDICISMKAKDYLKLPERVNNVITVQLTKKERALYDRLEKEQLLEYIDGDVVADTAAVLSNKLLQLSNGAVYDENGEVQQIHDQKLDALETIIESANGKPILLFYTFKHDRDRIKERFTSAIELDGSDTIEQWNAGKIPLLLAHPASAGHGLNLQDGGHNIVWFGLNWSLELYQQANARLDRQGQQNSVLVHHIVTENSMDERVMSVLEGKEEKQEALLAAVKARLEEYRGRAI